MKNILSILAIIFVSLSVMGQSTTENYIKNTTYQVETTTGVVSDDDKIESITYFDGLGRPKQNVAKQAGGNKEDIITHIDYDDFGRQTKDYLPYATPTNGGLYRTNGLTDTNTFYDTTKYEADFPSVALNDINAYSQKAYEASPLNRILKLAAPGKDWKQDNGHEIEFEYSTNTNNEVFRYDVNISVVLLSGITNYNPTLNLDISSGNNNGFYSAGELYKTITKDENHDGSSTKAHTTEEFKDKQGRVILKRTYGTSVTFGHLETNAPHDTYYVYDDYGNLSYVLSPNSGASFIKPNATTLSELCYQYKYDARNRLVEKKIPGKGSNYKWEYIVYNKLDKPILIQDPNMSNTSDYLFTKYDAYGRVIYTGKYNHLLQIDGSSRRSYFQFLANSSDSYEQHTSNITSIGGGNINYSYNAFPNSNITELHTVNYYDTYTDVDLPTGLSSTITTYYGLDSSLKVKGLPTVSKVRVLDTNDWITTVTYYDEKARPIYVYSKNDYLSTTDIVESKLDFTGKVLETKTTHTKGTNNPIETLDTFEYDHTGRLLSQKQKIDSLAEEIIVENNYGELGQLENKGVGGKITRGRLQTIDYTYNIRGWLKQINNVSALGIDLFGFKIDYNEGANALYNGNISRTQWQTASTDNSIKFYNYTYDALNRITSAIDNTEKYNLVNVNYDKNGNITNLIRKGHIVASPDINISSHFGYMDDLTYIYSSTSNKLLRVSDSSNNTYGFKDDYTGSGGDPTNDYTYDANGNMLTDANKNITAITYNHLNLPTKIVGNSGYGKLEYIYAADGTKLEKKLEAFMQATTTTHYAGNYVYEDTGSGSSLKFFNHPEGYVDAENGYDYVYQYKDHLGNVRLSYKEDTSVTPVNIDDDFNSSTNGWSNPGSGSINNTSQKLNLNITNKWNSTSKYLTITPNIPLHVEFDFENGTMDKPVFFVRERINGVWEPGGDRDIIWDVQNGHHVLDLTLTGDYIRLYFEKGSGNDDGTSTTCYVDNFKFTQNGLEILEENNYYPFGLEHKGYNNIVNSTNPAQNYTYNGKEKQEELGLNWHDYGARNYDAALGRWMNLDPLAEVYHTDTPYAYVLNNPLSFIDPDGRQVIGVTKDDAKKVHDDLNTVFAGKQFDALRALFTRGKKNNKKKFDAIDGDALKSALSGLSGDDLALAELVTGAINSKAKFNVEFAEKTDNLSTDGTSALNSLASKLYTDNGLKAPTNLPTTRTGNDVDGFGGSGLNVPTTDGSHSFILEGTGVSHPLSRRELTTLHEVFGHGIPSAKKTSDKVNSENAVRTENLVRRVMGLKQQRDGTNHGAKVKIKNPSALPIKN